MIKFSSFDVFCIYDNLFKFYTVLKIHFDSIIVKILCVQHVDNKFLLI